MRSIAGWVLTMWAIGGSAATAGAQPAADFWPHLKKLSPGTLIDVTFNAGESGRRYFLTASDAELLTLNLTDPALPVAAKNVLRNLAETNLEFLLDATPSGTVTQDNVRLGPAGIFVGERKVGEFGQVVERVTRDRVVDVRRPGGSPLSFNRPVEIGLSATGVLTWPAIGGDLRLTASFPISERHSIEFFGGPFAGNTRDADESFKGFYGVQVRQTLPSLSRAGAEAFLTYGGVGVVYTYTDTTCFPGKCVRTRERQVLPPLLGLIGGGVQYTIAPRLAVRVEAAGLALFVIPVGGRISIGFTVPIGSHPYARATTFPTGR